jgi:hypothetical protein
MTTVLPPAESPAFTGQIVVIGTGVVGARIARMATSDRISVVDRPSAVSFVGGRSSHPRVAILAVGGPHVALAAELLTAGVSVVSVADAPGEVADLVSLHDLALSTGACMVVGAAMSPGCSGLLARHLASSLARCDEIHVAVHATAGPACARQHHRALAGTAATFHEGDWMEQPAGTGRELCWFPEPVGAHDCYRAEMADPMLLHGAFEGVRRISARMSATRRDRLTSRLPMLRTPHEEGGIGALRVEVRGVANSGERVTSIAGIAEFVGAAAGATALACARAVVRGDFPAGAVTTADAALPTRLLLQEIASLGIRLQEFSGVAHQ